MAEPGSPPEHVNPRLANPVYSGGVRLHPATGAGTAHYWICPEGGTHRVSFRSIRVFDRQDRPLCPTHNVAMTPGPSTDSA